MTHLSFFTFSESVGVLPAGITSMTNQTNTTMLSAMIQFTPPCSDNPCPREASPSASWNNQNLVSLLHPSCSGILEYIAVIWYFVQFNRLETITISNPWNKKINRFSPDTCWHIHPLVAKCQGTKQPTTSSGGPGTPTSSAPSAAAPSLMLGVLVCDDGCHGPPDGPLKKVGVSPPKYGL